MFEEVVPTSVKQASFGRKVALIVRPAKSEGGGKIGGQGLGWGDFFTRPLFAGLPFNNVFSVPGFLHGSATVAMWNNERGRKNMPPAQRRMHSIISFARLSSFSFLFFLISRFPV